MQLNRYFACASLVLAAAVPLTLAASATSASTAAGPAAAPVVGKAPAAVRAATTSYYDWPTYHGDGKRSGYAISAKRVTTAPKQVWSIPLDGAVYGQPITVDRGMKIVVTEHNSVYRLAGNKVVWQRNLGAPVSGSSLPCGNIDPTGITGTPTFDRATDTLVAVAILNNPIRHVAIGMNPGTGAVKWSRTVDVPSSVPGITPQAMQQRGALLVSGRRVYVPYGGLAGDCSSYRGSVVGLDLDKPTTAALWNFTVPTSREGGIWSTPGAVENPGGGLLVAVGNGATAGSGTYDHSDSVLKIAAQQIQDSFSPSTWRTDNRDDLDLGSQGPAIVGDFVFIAGKSGNAYVLRRDHLGGIGGQVSQRALCRSFGGAAVVGSVVYVPCSDGLRAVQIGSTGVMTVLWHAPSNIAGSPVVGGGLVWALDTSAGVLHVMDPRTGATRYTMTVGAVNRFATPLLYGDAVFVGTLNGVNAFNW